MVIFIVGGSKSGKSMLAQDISKNIENNKGNLYYIATMKPYDDEDILRIQNHIDEREGYNFKTIEKNKDIIDINHKFKFEDTVLLDSVTALLTNEMFSENNINTNVYKKIIEHIRVLKEKVQNLVIVSDYLFSDSIIYDECTENFRKELGKINIEVAKFSDVVIEMSFKNKIIHKGKDLIGEII